MISARLKSKELMGLLEPSLTEGKNLLSEIELYKIIHEARKIPERYQGLSIAGLAWLVLGETEKGCSVCEQGLSIVPDESVSFCNYTIALRNFGLHARQYTIIQGASGSCNPAILAEVATISAFWLDIDLLEKVMPMLTAMEVPRSEDMAKWYDTLDYLHTHSGYALDLKKIGQLMLNVSDKYRVRLAGAHAFYVMSEFYTLSVEVNTDDPELLSQMNNDLADEIIVAGLADSECIGCFEAGSSDVC